MSSTRTIAQGILRLRDQKAAHLGSRFWMRACSGKQHACEMHAGTRILIRDKALGIKHLANQKRSEHGVGGRLSEEDIELGNLADALTHRPNSKS